MTRRTLLCLIAGPIAIILCAIGTARVDGAPDVTRGREVYNVRCVFCHGEGLGHPAWQLLALKKGKDKAEIVGRRDLTPVYIKQVVRNGLIEMPPFRASEISDRDLDALVDYLVHPNGTPLAKRP